MKAIRHIDNDQTTKLVVLWKNVYVPNVKRTIPVAEKMAKKMCEVLSHETRIANGLKSQTFQGADFPEK